MKKTRQTHDDYANDEIEPRKWGWKVRAFLFALKIAAITGALYGLGQASNYAFDVASAHATKAKEAILERVTVVRTVTEYKEIDEATLGDIIVKTAKEFQVDPLILTVLAVKESRGGEEDSLYRFEPEKFEELSATGKYRGTSTNELRMIASSHGVFHVMGYSAKNFCNLHWSRLYDTATAARCAATIVQRNAKDVATIKDPTERVRELFRRYNGGGPKAQKYADDAMSKLAGILYQKVAKGDL